jgi:hypothetical protein
MTGTAFFMVVVASYTTDLPSLSGMECRIVADKLELSFDQ